MSQIRMSPWRRKFAYLPVIIGYTLVWLEAYEQQERTGRKRLLNLK